MESILPNSVYTEARAWGTPSRLTVAFSLGGMMILVLLLSVFFFQAQSLRLDEAQSLWQSGRSPDVILRLVAEDVHVPFYHEVLHFWRLVAGDTVASARFLSLIFYVLSLPAIYVIGRTAYSARVGLMAALFMAVSPFMNWYGNEIRMYTLFMLFTILNQYFFIGLWRSPTNDTWIGYAATALLGVFTHYFFFLNLMSQAVFYFGHRRLFEPLALRRFAAIAAVIIISFAPWALYIYHLGEISNQVPQLAVPTTVDLFNTFSQFMVGFQNDHVNTFFLSLWPVGVLISFLALRRTDRTGRHFAETRYFLMTIIVSFIVAFAFSILVLPVFVSRYLIFTAPSLYLLLAYFLDTYAWRWMPWAVAGAMTVMLAVEIINPTAPVKENYLDATNYLDAHAGAQDMVVVSVPFTIYPVEYYYRGPAPIATLPQWDQYAHGAIPAFSETTLPAQVKELSDSHQNLWLLLSYDQGYNEKIRQYFDSHFKLLQSQHFSNGLDLYEYQAGYGTPLDKSVATAMR